MKAKFYFKLIALTMMLGAVININADAQSRGNSANNNQYKKNKKAYKKVEKANLTDDASAYSYEDRGNNPPYRTYDYDRYGNGKKSIKHQDNHYYTYKSNTYHHSRYGTVYRSFNTVPVRLRHSHGYYYFHGGHYYQLYPNVGYVRVEVPGSVIFFDIPSHAVRVRIDGHRYYRYGDLIFERYGDGYRLAPPSVMININL
jgi:hypothetical protein